MMERASHIRRAVTLGVVGGLAVWHVSLVGMVETFDPRRVIGGSITFNYVLMLGIVLIVGFVASRRAPVDSRSRLIAAAIAGLAAAVMIVLLAVLIDSIDVRRILVAATPRLVEILTFGRGLNAVGVILSLLAFTAAGTVGGVLTVIPQSVRRVVLTATVATLTVGLLADVIRVILPNPIARTLFAARALSIPGAVIIFALTALIASLHVTIQNSTMTRLTGVRQARLVRGERRFVQTFGLVFVLTFPLWSRIFLSNTADMVGLYILMALGLNLVVGYAGLLDLGFVAFFAIGAYTMAVLTSPEIGVLNIGFWSALPIAIGAALLAGILLGVPVLRMRGDYLAIATLGFGEIVRLLVLSDWLRPHLGGAQGITRVATPTIGNFSINSPQEFYYLILLGCGFAWFLSIRLKYSRVGRSWMAIREDEDVAQAMGINRVKSKLMAFAIGAALGGLSGAIFASLVGSVVPASFALLVSINVLAVIIVGGMGSLPGVVVGALALVALPELFREFQEYRLLVYGAVLVAMMLFRPAGLWPEATREREIEETLEQPQPLPQHAPDVGRAVSD